MTRPEQTEREARHVAAMIAALNLEVVGTAEAKAPPLPDFELSFADGRRVGVEITDAADPAVAAAVSVKIVAA